MKYVLKSDEAKIREGIIQDPTVLLVDSILCKAIEVRASDIHLEPSATNLRVRYRIDGILYDQEPVSSEKSLLVLSRLKILSLLDIAERRLPQDGKFIVNFLSRNIDLRVSVFPTIHGEKIVIRILDRFAKYISLQNLGCNEDVLKKIKELIKKQSGFLLVTGPTGSGKTTTLYAILSELNRSTRNIVTLEDPVEYNIDGITQSQVNPKAGFTFERGLRSLLRQDPDVAMVGEIRDRQTAKIAIEMALTGHLVLSTLHTNDASGAVNRLIDMGIEKYLISACLIGVISQRLVRLPCDFCKYEKDLSCKNCFGLGHKGRTGIFEILDSTNRKLF